MKVKAFFRRNQLNRSLSFAWAPVAAIVLGVAVPPDHAAQVNASCSGSPTANCTDVSVDGIRYTGGVSTVNVGEGEAGKAVVKPGTVGIELSRAGVNGADTPEAKFKTVLYDTDNNAATDKVSVVAAEDGTPQMVGGQFILDKGGDPQTFTIDTVTATNTTTTIYTDIELAKFLMTTTSDAGATISGGLTINNINTGGIGASFGTTNASGIVASSTGGRGGNGGCYSIILLYTWCDNGSGGGAAGSVVVNSNSEITVAGILEGKHGVLAYSLGGNGGDGGGFVGLASSAGGGGIGGRGSDVFVPLGADSDITTHGPKSHGVFAESRGGNGGRGGTSKGAAALGSKGGDGGSAGDVTVNNQGVIETFGQNSHGIFAKSTGAGAGAGSNVGGLYAAGGNGGGQSSGAKVTVSNSGSITTHLDDSFDILAQSIGGGGGDGGGAGGWFSVGGRAGSGGGSEKVTVYDSGTLRTSGDRSSAIFAQSIGGGGGNGGSAVSIASVVSVAVGGDGGLGGKGNQVDVTVNGSDIQTTGDDSNGVHAQSIGGGGGNGGMAVSGSLPLATPLSFALALGGNGAGGGDAGDLVKVTTAAKTFIDTTGSKAYGISAQSIGGGNGGAAFAGASGGISMSLGIGGKGDVAGAGNQVLVDNFGTNSELTTVSNLAGNAIVGGDGNEVVDNYANLTGSVNLGAGANAFNNHAGALLTAGPSLNLGSGNLLSNAGTLSPGGLGAVQSTTVSGNLTQTDTGVLVLDMNLADGASDRVNVTGTAQVGGKLELHPLGARDIVSGTRQNVVVSATGGAAGNALTLAAPTSAVVRYALAYPNLNDIAVSTRVDFAPAGLGAGGQAVGAHLNAIQAAGGTASLAPYISGLVELPDEASLNIAYEKLGPGALGNVTTSSTAASLAFNEAMHSCRQRVGDQRFLREGECNWVRLGGSTTDQQRVDLNPGYQLAVQTVAGGVQREFRTDTFVGVGVSYQKADLSSVYSSLDGERLEAGLIMKHRAGPTRWSASLSTGYGRYDSRRLVDLTTPGLQALAKQKVWSVALNGKVSRDLLSGDAAYVRPMLGLGITQVTRDAYAESGAGAANLNVAKARDTDVSLQPAIEFGGERQLADGTLLRPYLRLGVTHFLGKNDRLITANLQGAPAGVEPFTVVTEADTTYADLALGLDILRKSGTTVRLDYAGQFSGSSASRAFWLKLAVPF